mmetsp:Transcript_42799/g.136994  ORF Transcript_42799/g.136994 Transcript_42799/m.136994 type:complete len:208 (-) Transcript_42799:63-686(-)
MNPPPSPAAPADKGKASAGGLKARSAHLGKSIPCVGKPFKSWLTLSKQALAGKIGEKIYSGGNVRIGKQISPGMAKNLPDFPFLGDVDLPVKSCAMVGNSPALKKKMYGAAVDQHSIVMRFNNAPSKKWEARVGARTSLRWTNSRYSGYRERPGEAVISKFCQNTKKCSFNSKLLKIMLDKKVHPLNPRFDAYMEGAFKKAKTSPSS